MLVYSRLKVLAVDGAGHPVVFVFNVNTVYCT